MSERLDAELAARGLARSRTHAASLINDGLVTVDGRPVVKSSVKVEATSVVEVAEFDHYVSRAAHKLIAALDSFPVEVSGRLALDMGASTGGFTQVLRERGADPVIAVDVGHGQLSQRIRDDTGVVSVEGYNVRDMTPESLTAVSGVARRPELITGDLSFISLGLVLPAVRATIDTHGDALLLIKPQFEVGRTAVRGGLVTDPASRADAVAGVLWSAWDAGLGTHGVIASPLPGTHGNHEFVAWLRVRKTEGGAARGGGDQDAANPSAWLDRVNQLAQR